MEQKPYIITIVGPESSGKTTLARQLAGEFGCPWVPEYAREYLEGRGGYYNEANLELIAEGQLVVISNQLSVFGNQSPVGSGQSSVGSLQLAVGSHQLAVDSKQSSVSSLQLANINRETLKGVIQRNLEKNEVLAFYREDFGDKSRPVLIIDSGMMGIRMWAKIKYNKTIPVVEESLQEDITSMYILCRSVWPWESDPLREAPLLLDRVWIYNHYLKELFLSQAK